MWFIIEFTMKLSFSWVLLIQILLLFVFKVRKAILHFFNKKKIWDEKIEGNKSKIIENHINWIDDWPEKKGLN